MYGIILKTKIITKRQEQTMQVAGQYNFFFFPPFQFLSTYWETGMSHEHIKHLKQQLPQVLPKDAWRLQPGLRPSPAHVDLLQFFLRTPQAAHTRMKWPRPALKGLGAEFTAHVALFSLLAVSTAPNARTPADTRASGIQCWV